jgi:hypothetical protein
MMTGGQHYVECALGQGLLGDVCEYLRRQIAQNSFEYSHGLYVLVMVLVAVCVLFSTRGFRSVIGGCINRIMRA